MIGDFRSIVVTALLPGLLLSCTRSAGEPREVVAARPAKRGPPAETADDRWIEQELEQEGYCLPEETELCGCPNGISGVRRCNAAGTEFGPCDACPSVMTCGTERCQIVRVDALALSVAPCCPAGRPNRCGVDVSHFVKLHGYAATCLELDAPGAHDSSCPSTSVPVPGKGEVTLQGCRAMSGACGYDVDVPGLIDLGCTEKPQREGS